MKASEIRKQFLDFFKEKDHSEEKPASLIPHGDPSLLFTGAGMNQFKRLFFGRSDTDISKAVTCQRCFRATDIENVGRTSRHLTFLEMLGNFSFGDYFKEEAVSFAWEFLRNRLNIREARMLATVFEDDDETYQIWNRKIGLPRNRIIRMGREHNFWEMGKTGPCGPASEIIIDRGEKYGCGKSSCGPACECDRHIELWNLVFTQFNRTPGGGIEPLGSKNIDTGMGLERAACIIQGVDTVFDTDILRPLVARAEELLGTKEPSTCRIIADHVRACAFLIADGVVPSNDGRGYVLRKLIRRITEKKLHLDRGDSFFRELVNLVCFLMKDFYPRLEKESANIILLLGEEEARFSEVFEKLPELERRMDELRKRGVNILDGREYFRFYDTYGIPRETIREKAESFNMEVDEEGFEAEMEKQKSRSRKLSGFRDSEGDIRLPGLKSEFTGYTQTETSSRILRVLKNGEKLSSARAGESCAIIAAETPFYPESGGQKGDSGIVEGREWSFEVRDTLKADEAIIHRGTVKKGEVKEGDRCALSVDIGRRKQTAANHTATHLLQFALKKILGEHVRQAGSEVDSGGLRFDFTHPSRMSPEEISGAEETVNSIIRENVPVEVDRLPAEKAIEEGAIALPGEKYGDFVRVVKSGKYSMELCAGTHCASTGEIGIFIIQSESSTAAGIRRIEALTGREALKRIQKERALLRETAAILRTSVDRLPSKAENLIKTNREAEKQISALKAGKTASKLEKIIEQAEEIEGIKVITHSEEGLTPDGLSTLADGLRKKVSSGIGVIASRDNNRVHLVAVATRDLLERGIDAGKIIGETASIIGGGGGGRPDFAKAGGKNPEKLGEAMSNVPKIIKRQLHEKNNGA